MILSDRDLRDEIEAGRLVIEPYDATALQPSSIDLRIGSRFRVFANHRYKVIDVRKPMDQLTDVVEASEEEPFILHPGEFVLASTLENVTLPDDLVARLEGKSSLGRLGLLIHSSLPGGETVLFSDGVSVTQRPISEVVRKRLAGSVVAFHPQTFNVGYHEVTGWHEGAPDRIFEVVLASGRRVQLTGGHDLFTLDRDGDIAKLRVHQLAIGTKVAIAGSIPDPPTAHARLDLVALAPESARRALVCGGPSVSEVFRESPSEMASLLAINGIEHHRYYLERNCLPLTVALQDPSIARTLGPDDWIAARGGRHRLPAVLEVDEELAWLFGLYVAEGFRRHQQFTISNTDPRIVERAGERLTALGLPVYRRMPNLTCCSVVLSNIIEWLGMGGRARDKRIPTPLLGWPSAHLKAFLEGFVDGDGSAESRRTSLWTSSEQLVGDLLLLASRLGERAAASGRDRGGRHLWQITLPHKEHKLLTAVPLPDRLLSDISARLGMTQVDAAAAAGFSHNSQLNNIERRRSDGLRLRTLRRLRKAYSGASPHALGKLDRLVEGDLAWDAVVDVRDTGRVEPVFDLEVRPSGYPVENLLAGHGGVFVSNTAGFVDAGFTGELTLELSNVANLPITIYPGMRVGQLCLFRMTSPAEHPYGTKDVGSKYQSQIGPTPSRYHENFPD